MPYLLHSDGSKLFLVCNSEPRAIGASVYTYFDVLIRNKSGIEALAQEQKQDHGRDTIIFLIDLWDRKGPIPRTLDEVLWRQKCIQYGSGCECR
jgi:hypothetical protein